METKGYLELLFNDSSNACYFAEMDSHKIVFINKTMEKKLRNYDDYEGKKCYEVIHNREIPCNFCPMNQLQDSKFIEQRIFNEATRSYQRANSTLMDVNDTKICACKYFVAFPDDKNRAIPYHKAIGKCVEILGGTYANNAVSQFLALLGQFHQSEKSFFYQLDGETGTFHCKHLWKRNRDDEDVVYDNSKAFVDDFLLWLTAITPAGWVELSESTKYSDHSFERKLLDMYGFKNLVLCPTKNKLGIIIGFLGISNRNAGDLDLRLLKTVTRYVEENDSKNVMENELKAVNDLDEQTGFFNRRKYMEMVRDLEENLPLSLGVLFVSLGDLRRVNEVKGFAAGNEMIQKSAHFLTTFFSEPFYRLTGDEFVCFITDSTEGDFFRRAKILDEQLRRPESPDLRMGCSWDNQEINVLRLVADADINVHDV